MEIDELLRIAMEKEASDLHFVVPNPPTLRVYGQLVPLTELPGLTPQMTMSVFQAVSTERERQVLEQERELDFAYDPAGIAARCRVNAAYQRGSITLVFRLIPSKIPSMAELGLPEVCRDLIQLPRGLILVTGPTGSGKSSTLAAMLEYLNENYERKVVTLEDPIEFLHHSKRCVVSQREVGSDAKSFAGALRHVTRQDPNVIMVGEMRDLETMSTAITAAETGHLVLSTLHTIGAAESVSRILGAFSGAEQAHIRTQIGEVLEAVISQVLLRRADGNGRVAAFEVMIGTTAIKNLIRQNQITQIVSYLESGQRLGMRTLDQDLERLSAIGVITPEEAMAVVRYRQNDEHSRQRSGSEP